MVKKGTIKGLEKYIEESIGELELSLKQSSDEIGAMSLKYTQAVRENDKLCKKIELLQEKLASNGKEILEKDERIKTYRLELSESQNLLTGAKRNQQLQVSEIEKLKQENWRLYADNVKQQRMLGHTGYDLTFCKQMLAQGHQEIVNTRQEASRWWVAYGSLKSQVIEMQKSHPQPQALAPAG